MPKVWFVGVEGASRLARKNRRFVTDEPVEFEKQPVEVGDFRRITGHSRGIDRICL